MPKPLLWKGFQEQWKCNNFAYLQENNTLLSWHIQASILELKILWFGKHTAVKKIFVYLLYRNGGSLSG